MVVVCVSKRVLNALLLAVDCMCAFCHYTENIVIASSSRGNSRNKNTATRARTVGVGGNRQHGQHGRRSTKEVSTYKCEDRIFHSKLIHVLTWLWLYTRISSLEEQLRDPNSKTSVYSLLDVLTALIADCDHANIKRIKAIEAFTSRCK